MKNIKDIKNIQSFEKTKSEFILNRLDKILISDKQKKSQKIFRELFERLQNYDKELLMLYVDEINAEESDTKEIIYSTGFFDGILAVIKYYNQ